MKKQFQHPMVNSFQLFYDRNSSHLRILMRALLHALLLGLYIKLNSILLLLCSQIREWPYLPVAQEWQINWLLTLKVELNWKMQDLTGKFLGLMFRRFLTKNLNFKVGSSHCVNLLVLLIYVLLIFEWQEDYVAWVCDQDAYACSGQKCSAQSMLFMHEVSFLHLTLPRNVYC